MTEELDKALVDILTKTTNAMEQGADFIMSEIPDVVYQLLLWYGIYNFVMFLTGIALVVGTTIAWWKAHKSEWVEDLSDGSYFYFPSIIVIPSVLAFEISLINLTWLKIWIAPKLFLIEYTASLVK